MTRTPNHSYNIPKEGEQNWHLDLNKNFTDIDADIEIRDTEANKSDYESKIGAKYEATDSGAIYYGNGSSWVLADRELNSLHTRSTNNILTPQDGTIQSIQNLVDSHRSPYIKLKPGVLYEGDTQLVLDSYPDSGAYADDERTITINAHGAGVNYTGSAKSAVRIFQGDVYDTQRDDASAFGGQTKIEYGSWSGPGVNISNSSVIREDDTFGTVIKPTEVGGAEHGIICVNNGAWSEGQQIGSKFSGSYYGDKTFDVGQVKYLVRLAGGNSSFPDAGSNGGGPSFRDTNVVLPWNKASNIDGAITFWQDHASTHGGDHVLKGFLPKGGTGYRLDSEAAVNRFCTLRFESEGGDEDTVAINIENANGKPSLIAPRFETNGTSVKGTINRLDETGWKGSRLGIGLKNDSGFNNTWLEMSEPGNDPKYRINNQRNAFTLETLVDTYINGRGPNGKAPFRGQEFQAEGNSADAVARRAFKGKFDEHPSTSNGDTWYITGDGTPAEGFYGQTSNGPVRFD